MKASDFAPGFPGSLVPLAPDLVAFVPNAIQRGRPLEAGLGRRLGEANRALGQLNSGISALPRPELFWAPFRTNEAVLSSSIEGTVTTFEEALVNQVVGLPDTPASRDGIAVKSYIDALSVGIEQLNAGYPLGMTMICGLHRELVKLDPGLASTAGRIRHEQVVIGSDEARGNIKLATFVPPPPSHLQPCLGDLISYLSDAQDDPILRAALTHYQFEAIHPFKDGNGRVGRLLIPLQLAREGVVNQPWVYPSTAIARRKKEYYSKLLAVSTRSDFTGWIEFFASILVETANETIKRLELLRFVREELTQRVHGHRGQAALRIVSELMRWPAFTLPIISEQLNMKYRTAKSAVTELEALGIVRKLELPLRVGGQIGRPASVYVCDAIVAVFNAPFSPTPSTEPDESSPPGAPGSGRPT